MTATSFKRTGLSRPERTFSPLGCTTAVILAGGAGSRLQPVIQDRSKVMAPVHGVPFLAYLLEHISGYGIQKVVLCTGVFADSISSFFGSQYRGMGIHYSHESEPRGTAGAVRGAMEEFDDYPVLVMNGDSFCAVDVGQFVHWHFTKGGSLSLVLARVDQGDRFGTVQVDAGYRLIEFSEKRRDTGRGWINAGVYLMERAVIESIPVGKVSSLEQDIFPQWIADGCYGYPSEGRFLDIGTPDSYRMAEEFFPGARENWAIRHPEGVQGVSS